MEEHELEIRISKKGEVTAHVRGAKGKRCLDYAELLREWIGPIVETKTTHEFYEPEAKVRIDAEEEQQVRDREP